jgi:hypothetical protein
MQINMALGNVQIGSDCMPRFTPEEAVEIALLLWEYDRDGGIAIDNFIHREPELSGKVALNVIPKHLRRTYLAYLHRREG